MSLLDDDLPGSLDIEYMSNKLKEKEKINRKKLEQRRNETIQVKPAINKEKHLNNSFGNDTRNHGYDSDNSAKKFDDDYDIIINKVNLDNSNPLQLTYDSDVHNKAKILKLNQYDSTDEENEISLVSDAPKSDMMNKTSNLNNKFKNNSFNTTKLSDDDENDDNEQFNFETKKYFNLAHENIDQFMYIPAPQGCMIRCHITRDKRGVEKGFYPSYYLYLEQGNKKTFLLSARKKKSSKTSYYLISHDPIDLNRNGENFCGKLRSNLIGTNFTLYDDGENPNKSTDELKIRREMLAVIYDINLFGLKGPRKMNVIIPGMISENVPIDIKPKNENESLIERFKKKNSQDLVELKNKEPVWNESTQTHLLEFNNRSIRASVKNFQIIHPNDENYIVMQFGRVELNKFICDFSYPMSAFQAFGIALSSFDSKLACE